MRKRLTTFQDVPICEYTALQKSNSELISEQNHAVYVSLYNVIKYISEPQNKYMK